MHLGGVTLTVADLQNACQTKKSDPISKIQTSLLIGKTSRKNAQKITPFTIKWWPSLFKNCSYGELFVKFNYETIKNGISVL